MVFPGIVTSNSSILHQLDPAARTWTALDSGRVHGPVPAARIYAGLVAIGWQLYLFGGTLSDGSM
jgi:hypothetical protein